MFVFVRKRMCKYYGKALWARGLYLVFYVCGMNKAYLKKGIFQ